MSSYAAIRKDISHTQDLVSALWMLDVECRADNGVSQERTLDALEIIVPRYSLRTLYHAGNFVSKLLEVVDSAALRAKPGDTVGLQIGPEIYFEFDAFLYSAKAILEANILKRARAYLTGNRLLRFGELARTAHAGFVKGFLKPFRDEAVHLNYLGTSVSQLAFVTKVGDDITVKLHTTFTQDGKELNLVDVFCALLKSVTDTICSTMLLMAQETVTRFGAPKGLDHEYHIGDSVFRVRDLIDYSPSGDV